MQGSDVTFHNVISQSSCNFAGGAAAGRIRSLAAGYAGPTQEDAFQLRVRSTVPLAA